MAGWARIAGYQVRFAEGVLEAKLAKLQEQEAEDARAEVARLYTDEGGEA